MRGDWEFSDEVMAAGATCPMPECGALMVAYLSNDGEGHENAEPWEFTCPRCGFEFVVPEADLIFQSVPEDWLLAKVHTAYSKFSGRIGSNRVEMFAK